MPLVALFPALLLQRQAAAAFDGRFSATAHGVVLLASGVGLVAGLLACALLVSARRRAPVIRGSAVGDTVAIIGGLLLLGESGAVLLRVVTTETSWWTFGGGALFQLGATEVVVVTILALAGMALAGIGGGMQWGSSSRLAGIGGGLLLGAVLVRVLSQEILAGMFSVFAARAEFNSERTVVLPLEAANTYLVPALTLLGLLLVIAGVLTRATGHRGHAPGAGQRR